MDEEVLIFPTAVNFSKLTSLGAANIRPDDTPYTDGEIVREGPVGNQGDGPYSAGRGGAGNIDADGKVVAQAPHDAEIIPETATRIEKEEPHHVGRGGAGNELHIPDNGDKGDKVNKGNKGWADKIKAIFKGSNK
jgi:hypothetical protein